MRKFLSYLLSCKVEMDGETMMAYVVVASVAAPCCFLMWHYGINAVNQGNRLEGIGLIICALAVGICLIVVPFNSTPSPEGEALRLENELRDLLEADICRDGHWSKAQGMRLAGLAITAGKIRSKSDGTTLREATLCFIRELVTAEGSWDRAWRKLDSLDLERRGML